MLIELSSISGCRARDISSYRIVKREDDYWEVAWVTEDGEIKSDVFPGRVAARNYVNDIREEIKKIILMDVDDE